MSHTHHTKPPQHTLLRCQMSAITDLTIKNATEGIHWDSSLKGFGIRIGKNTKTFIVLVASGRRHRIGHYPSMSLSEARKEAKRILSEKTLGKIRPKQFAFEDAKNEFLHSKQRKAKTLYDYTRLLDSHYDYGRKNIADINPREIVQKLNRLKPSEKHHAFVVGKMFFTWCVRQAILDRSPMESMETPKKNTPRERILNHNELCELTEFLKTHETPFTRICLLLLYTGQRKSEIASLKWECIDEQNKSIILPETKNNLPHKFPFGPTVQTILDSIPRINEYVFPAAKTVSDKTTIFNGWSKAKLALDQQLTFDDWTLHDLRRTFASGMAQLGVPQIVVEKLLNHYTGGVQSTITRTYNRHHYLPEMREAVLKWDTYIDSLSTP